VTLPEVWFVYRSNPAISFWDTKALSETMARFPFVVAFAYTRDETNHMADILLPDATDLESLQLIRIGGSKFIEQFWESEGFALRQPVVEAQGEARDFTEVATELARRTGLLEGYNAAINRGAAGVPLKGASWDFSLAPERVYGREEIWDAVCRSASAELSDGKQTQGLDWWKENGFATKPFAHADWYLYPTLIAQAALRNAVPGAPVSHRQGTGQSPARERHAMVGQATCRVSAAAAVEGLSGRVGTIPGGHGREGQGFSVLAAYRAQHAICLGRQRRHAADQGSRRQCVRPPWRDHEYRHGGQTRCRRW
jgi:anaerobic selenocysteine-containing dehydrogenase